MKMAKTFKEGVVRNMTVHEMYEMLVSHESCRGKPVTKETKYLRQSIHSTKSHMYLLKSLDGLTLEKRSVL